MAKLTRKQKHNRAIAKQCSTANLAVMTKPKYKVPQRTAGKWEVNTGMVQTVDGIAIAYMAREESRTVPVERDANAHSIAALPALVEMLESVYDTLDFWIGQESIKIPQDVQDEMAEVRARVKAALALTIYK